MTWRPARSLEVLIKQVNTSYPNRPKQSDGLIGDQAHAARVSSHNPDAHGVVRGWDCTTAPFCQRLADELAALGKTDERVWYVIWNRRIASREHGFTWRPYSGTDPHTSHIHLSVSDDPAVYDRTDPWPVLGTVTAHASHPPQPLGDDMKALFTYNGKEWITDGFQKRQISTAAAKAFAGVGVPRIQLSGQDAHAIPGGEK